MIKIREAKTFDLEQLALLFDAYRVFYKKQTNLEDAKKFLLERIEQKDSKIFIVETDTNQIAGFVQLYPLFSSVRMKKLWLLNDLFVSSNFRGQGLSVKLIEHAKQLVVQSGACGMFLETEKTNTIGNRLYPKTGFTLNQNSNFYEWNLKH